MSGFVAHWNRDGRPIDRANFERALDSVASRGGDARGDWIDGAVALGHHALWTTPEARNEREPHREGALAITMDGRVDNREELLSELALGRHATDVEIVLAAYRRWGERSPEKILGDFAFFIWDEAERRGFCARDVVGIRPFYYSLHERRLRCGSSPRAILEDPAVPRRLNEGMIAEYLCGEIFSLDQTFWLDVFRLPPAHWMSVSAEAVRIHRYWQLDLDREIRLKSDDAYAEEFLAIFEEAVRCRLRTGSLLGTHLSGGLDSSSVTVTAAGLLGDESERLEAFSQTFPGLPWCDESPWIDAVASRTGVRVNRFPTPERATPPDLTKIQMHFDLPEFPNGSMTKPITASARERGVRVMLSGFGGDEFFYGSHWVFAEMVSRLRVGRLLEVFLSYRKTRGARGALRYLYQHGVVPLVPNGIARSVRRRRGRDLPPRWITPELASRVSLQDRLARRILQAPFRHPERAGVASVLRNAGYVHGLELTDREDADREVEGRHPFLDRRVIEFGVALPSVQRLRGSVNRWVVRHAMRGKLPDDVRARADKADFSRVFAETFRGSVGEQLDVPYVGSRGWVDGKVVSRGYRDMCEDLDAGGKAFLSSMNKLWMIRAVDLWLHGMCPEPRGKDQS